jgi:pentatricopeptide repeat protein
MDCPCLTKATASLDPLCCVCMCITWGCVWRQARQALLAQVETVFDEMKRSGHHPDKFTLNAMVLAYTNARLATQVRHWVGALACPLARAPRLLDAYQSAGWVAGSVLWVW